MFDNSTEDFRLQNDTFSAPGVYYYIKHFVPPK